MGRTESGGSVVKTISVDPDILTLAADWLRASPTNAALGCFIGYFALWAVSYKLKDLL